MLMPLINYLHGQDGSMRGSLLHMLMPSINYLHGQDGFNERLIAPHAHALFYLFALARCLYAATNGAPYIATLV